MTMQDEALRAATEDDVDAALRGASFGDALGGIDTAVLLEFHNRMLDRVLGEEPDSHGVALLHEKSEAPPKGPPDLRLVEEVNSNGQWPFEKLSDWIAKEGEAGPTEELRDWLDSRIALTRIEKDQYGQVEEFCVFEGTGAVYLGHSWRNELDGEPWKHGYTLSRYSLAETYDGQGTG